MNIRFEYMYRDASNYKNYGAVTFSNPEGLSEETIRKGIEDTLCGDCFMAAQVNVPEIFLWIRSPFNEEDDHVWHEFHRVEKTDLPTDDDRTISDFMKEMKKAMADGWDDENVLEQMPEAV